MIRGMEDNIDLQTNYDPNYFIYAIWVILISFVIVFLADGSLGCRFVKIDENTNIIPTGVSTSVQITPRYEQQIHTTRRSRSYDSLEMV